MSRSAHERLGMKLGEELKAQRAGKDRWNRPDYRLSRFGPLFHENLVAHSSFDCFGLHLYRQKPVWDLVSLFRFLLPSSKLQRSTPMAILFPFNSFTFRCIVSNPKEPMAVASEKSPL